MSETADREARRAAPALSDFTRFQPEMIRYGDTDRQGHVNNAVYATYLETGRVHFFRDPAFALDEGAEWMMARAEIDYLRELTWPGEVRIGTRVERIGRTSITLAQGVFYGDVCVAAGRAVVVRIDPTTRRPSPIPEEIAERLRATG